ncbi:MAG TPA: hypothetical protein VH640_12920 [Bryobacteraceae bacterium]|jgi:hypothetical protein
MKSAPKPPVRFPLTLGLRYQAKSEHGIISGTSATKWIGSRWIAFAVNEDIQEKMKLQLAIAWPYLLEDRVRLQLIILAVVTNVANGIAEAAILQYDFRTRKDQETAAAAGVDLAANAIPPSVRAASTGALAHP